MNDLPTYRLLTGTTGLIGSQLLALQLRRHVPVCVLVRANDHQAASDRINEVLRPFETRWKQRLARPCIIIGDLTLPGLGLSERDRNFVRSRCSSLMHLGASLSFRPADAALGNEPYRTNFEGTKELISLCENSTVNSIHYVSTAYVCGNHKGRFSEQDLCRGQTFANDYENSKLQTEQWLATRNDFTLTIYRPSIVIDTSGDSPVSQDRTLYVALSMYQTMTKKFGFLSDGNWFDWLGCSGSDRKNLVEASWVAMVLDAISDHETLHGKTYHLTAPVGTKIEEIEQAFRDVVGAKAATKNVLQKVPASTAPGVATRLLAFSKNALTRKTQAIAETIAGPYLETFAPYFRNDPEFDRANLRLAMAITKVDDQAVIGATEIAEFARIQDAAISRDLQKKVRDKKAKDSQPRDSTSAPTHWLKQLHAHSDISNSRPLITTTAWGVALVGEDGGDWRIDLSPLCVSSGGQCCPRRIYSDLPTWRQLLASASNEAIRCATDEFRLVAEFDAEFESMDGQDRYQALVRFIGTCRELSREHVGVNR